MAERKPTTAAEYRDAQRAKRQKAIDENTCPECGAVIRYRRDSVICMHNWACNWWSPLSGLTLPSGEPEEGVFEPVKPERRFL